MNIKSHANKLKINTKEIIPPSGICYLTYLMHLGLVFLHRAYPCKIWKAKIPLPGGCLIGSRPIDEHINSKKVRGNLKFESNYLTAEVITLIID